MALTAHLGLVVGLGVAPGLHYQRSIAEAVRARGRSLEMTTVQGDVPTVFSHMDRGDIDGLARYLATLIERLAAAGAEFAAISAVMPHAAIDELRKRSRIPLVSMLDVVADALERHRYRRVALFGAQYPVESRLYGRLNSEQVATLPADVSHRLYRAYRELAHGHIDEAYADEFFRVGEELVSTGAADAIVIAGTDLSPIFRDRTVPFPFIDAAEAHIAALVDRVL